MRLWLAAALFWGAATLALPGLALDITWQGGGGETLAKGRDALFVSGAYHNDAPFRLRIEGAVEPPSVRVSLVSIDRTNNQIRDRLELGKPERVDRHRAQTPWISLVADPIDARLALHPRRALRAFLGDRIEAHVRVGGNTPQLSEMPVGLASGKPEDPRSIIFLAIRVFVLRNGPLEPPFTGGDAAGASQVMRHQLGIVGETLAPCGIAIVEEASITVASPPLPNMLAVGERFGLFASGGEVRLAVNGRRLGPFAVHAGSTPWESALEIASRLRAEGFVASAIQNARREDFASATADVLVRSAGGGSVRLTPWADAPLTTDLQQSLDVAQVDLTDGLEAYRDREAKAGTLEQRALFRTLAENAPGVIDVFVVGHLESAAVLGQSFTRPFGSTLGDVVVIGTLALAQARQSNTLSHEIGHILLGDLRHKGRASDVATTRLMHAQASSALNGPREITPQECRVMRARAIELSVERSR